MRNNAFTEKVTNSLGNYVYRLVDPRNAETFYVGRGVGNRVFDHVSECPNLRDDEDELSAKLSRISSIRNDKLDVIHIIHRHGLSPDEAKEVESALIDAYPGLSNEISGRGADRGPSTPQQLERRYALPSIDFEPSEKLVLININNLSNTYSIDEIYRQTRFAWRADVRKLKQAEYVLSVMRGVVVGAFIVDEWLPADHEEFRGFGTAPKGRIGFKGQMAPDEIWNKYVGVDGKRIVLEGMKHIQFPIRYWGIR